MIRHRRFGFWSKWFGASVDNSGDATLPNVAGFLPPDAFRDEIEREILRSDRSNHPLTLVTLSLDGQAPPETVNRAWRELALCVARRMRRTDCKGWLDGESGLKLGILLWNTPAQVVDGIVRSLQAAYDSTAPRHAGAPSLALTWEVFVYPQRNDGDGGRRERPDEAPVREHDRGITVAASTATDHEHNGTNGRQPHPDRRRATPNQGSILPAHAIQAMEALRAHRLPRWKRATDVVLSLAAIVVLSPLLVAIALAVKLTSRGPILFRQDRVGINGRIFKCLKFRSMRVDYDQSKHAAYLKTLIKEADGGEKPMEKLDGVNPAITPIGRIIRTTHLDELPQLFNVLRGDMSIVGPRPCIPYEAENYQPWCLRRFDTLPGITGLWQVNGKNHTTFKEMIRLDLAYIERCSFWLDLKIMLKTIPTIVQDVIEARQMKKGGVRS